MNPGILSAVLTWFIDYLRWIFGTESNRIEEENREHERLCLESVERIRGKARRRMKDLQRERRRIARELRLEEGE